VPLLDLFSDIHTFFTVEPRTGHSAPSVASTGLSRREGSPPPIPGSIPPNAAQDTISLPCYKGTLLTRVQLGVYQDLHVLFLKLFLLVPWAVTPHVQDFALLLVELHKMSVSPCLQNVPIHLDDSTALWCSRHSSQFCLFCNLLRVHSARSSSSLRYQTVLTAEAHH